MERWWRSQDWRSYVDAISDPSSARLALTAAANGLSVYNHAGGRFALAAAAEDPAVVMAFHSAGDDTSYPTHAADALQTYDDVTAALQSAGVPEPIAAGRAALVFGATSVPHDYVSVAKHVPVPDSTLVEAADQALAEEFAALVAGIGKADEPWDESSVNRDEIGRFAPEHTGVQTRKVVIDGVAYALKESASVKEREQKKRAVEQRKPELSDDDILARASERARQAEQESNRKKRSERKKRRLKAVSSVDTANAENARIEAQRQALLEQQRAQQQASRTKDSRSERTSKIHRLMVAEGSNERSRRKRSIGGKVNEAGAGGASSADDYFEQKFYAQHPWVPSIDTTGAVPIAMPIVEEDETWSKVETFTGWNDTQKTLGHQPIPLIDMDTNTKGGTILYDAHGSGAPVKGRQLDLGDVYDATELFWSFNENFASVGRKLLAVRPDARTDRSKRIALSRMDAIKDVLSQTIGSPGRPAGSGGRVDIDRAWVKVRTKESSYDVYQDKRSGKYILVPLGDLLDMAAQATEDYGATPSYESKEVDGKHWMENAMILEYDHDTGDAHWESFRWPHAHLGGGITLEKSETFDESSVNRDDLGRFAEQASSVTRNADSDADRAKRTAARNARRRRRLRAVNAANLSSTSAAAAPATAERTASSAAGAARANSLATSIEQAFVAAGSTDARKQAYTFRQFVLSSMGPDGFADPDIAATAYGLIDRYPSTVLDYSSGELESLFLAASKSPSEASSRAADISARLRSGRKDANSELYGLPVASKLSIAVSALNGLASAEARRSKQEAKRSSVRSTGQKEDLLRGYDPDADFLGLTNVNTITGDLMTRYAKSLNRRLVVRLTAGGRR